MTKKESSDTPYFPEDVPPLVIPGVSQEILNVARALLAVKAHKNRFGPDSLANCQKITILPDQNEDTE